MTFLLSLNAIIYFWYNYNAETMAGAAIIFHPRPNGGRRSKPMLYRMMADLAVLAHIVFVLFVVCGGAAVLRWHRLAWLHLPAAIWGAVVEFRGWLCPLTVLEAYFRRLGGEDGYGGSFIEHYLEPVIYPSWLTPHVQILLGLGVVAINVVLYALLWRRRRSRET